MNTTSKLGFLGTLFVTLLIVSNVVAVKIGDFGGQYLSVAIIVFPLTYVIGDVVTEVYGYGAMRRIIWTGFLCNLVAVAVFWIALRLPSAPFFAAQDAFARILGSTPRILAASFAGFLVGGFTNSWIMATMKIRQKGRMLPVRTILSTVVGEGLDSFLFVTLAFAGVFPSAEVWKLVLFQWLGKSLIEAAVTPVTVLVAAALKKSEGSDVYDTQTNFNPVSL